jgi:hypothetical protein
MKMLLKKRLVIKMYNLKELKIGIRIEMEHTQSKKVAERIAKDHLREYPNYYTKGLLPMEKMLKKLNKKGVKK